MNKKQQCPKQYCCCYHAQ